MLLRRNERKSETVRKKKGKRRDGRSAFVLMENKSENTHAHFITGFLYKKQKYFHNFSLKIKRKVLQKLLKNCEKNAVKDVLWRICLFINLNK